MKLTAKKAIEKLEVDCFEIDLETLLDAVKQGSRGNWAADFLAREVVKNLEPESKKKFEEYQEQNNPCR